MPDTVSPFDSVCYLSRHSCHPEGGVPSYINTSYLPKRERKIFIISYQKHPAYLRTLSTRDIKLPQNNNTQEKTRQQQTQESQVSSRLRFSYRRQLSQTSLSPSTHPSTLTPLPPWSETYTAQKESTRHPRPPRRF